MLWYIGLLILVYLLGSINTSIIYSVHSYRKDIRNVGSGNAGTTNMLRSFGKTGAAVTFAVDFLKGVIAVYLVMLCFGVEYNLDFMKALSGFVCVIGHCFPVFFGFKGGKGIATCAGVVVMMDWRVFLIGIGLFILLTVLTRFVSLGSLTGSMAYPVGLAVFRLTGLGHTKWAAIIVAFATALLIWFLHRKNIVALLKGTERKLGEKKEVTDRGDTQ